MVSNQALTRSSSRLGLTLAGLAVLGLVAGCQSTREVGSTAPAPDRPAPQIVSTAPQQTAIEAALAREQSGGAPVTMSAEPAQRVVLNPNAPMSYTVQRGDTLWDISSMFLRDPWLWPEIWHVNPTVQNPHLIYPGDVLTLAYGADGSPQVSLVRGDALRVQPLVRSSAFEGGSIPTIPYEAIAAFLGKPGIVSQAELDAAPRVAAMRDRHLVAAAGNTVYVKNMGENPTGRYSVLRVGDPLVDPDDKAVLGYLSIYGGVAQVSEVSELSRAVLLDSARETAAGDVLLPEDVNSVASDIIPHAPAADIDARIMAVVDGVSLIGQFQVVALNRGASDGVSVGHVLAIFRDGEVVRDGSCRRTGLSLCKGTVKLPSERAGVVLVFKTYDEMSYGLILDTTEPVAVADHARTP